MPDDPARGPRLVKLVAFWVAMLSFLCIGVLMILTRNRTGDDGDIAGVVASATGLAVIGLAVAAAAAAREGRARR